MVFSYSASSQGLNQIDRNNVPIRQLSIEYWNTDDGLLSNNLNDVIQTRDGFIWATTFNGIIRYDGVQYDEFDKTNIDSIDFNAFYEIFEDKKGGLWITTQTNGVLRYDNGRFFQYKHNNELPKSIRAVIEDAKGHIWVGTRSKGLFKDEGNGLLPVEIVGAKSNKIMELANGKDGSIWVGTDGEGVFHYKNGAYTQYSMLNGLNNNVVLTIKEINDSTVLVGSYDGLNVINPIKQTVEHLKELKGGGVNDIQVAPNGNVWFAGKGGVARSNGSLENFEYLTEEDGLPAREITAIGFDFEENIWLSTRKGGLVKLKKGNFINITTKDGLSLKRISYIYQDGEDGYYIGSDNGDLDYLNPNGALEQVQLESNIKGETFRDILVEKDQTWICSYAGLVQIKNGKEKLWKEKSEIPTNLLRRILKTKHHNYVIGTRNSGLLFFDGESEFIVLKESDGLGSNYILSINETEDGTLIVGTNGGGLNFIDKNRKITTYHLHKDPSGALVFNTVPYENGLLLSTNIGLWYFENGTFTKINIGDNLGTDTFFDLVLDKNNYLWFSSSEGVFSLKVNDIALWRKKEIAHVPVSKYNDKDGMVSRECAPAARMLLNDNNELWIPTLAGISIINSNFIKKNPSIPPVYITSVAIDDVVQPFTKKVTIDPGHFRFTLNFTALSYYAPSKMKFKYKLEGIDDHWQIATSDDREASYTNIAPGKYKFKLIASNNDGVWNNKGAEAWIVIEPFFYQTPWFRVGGSLLLVILFTGIFQFRIYAVNKRNKTLKKLNDELDSFVYSTSHDLRAPLASVLGLLNLAKHEKSEEIKQEYLTMMEKSVTKLDGFIKDIIDYSRNSRLEIQRDPLHLKELVLEVLEGFKFMDDEDRIEKNINVDIKEVFYTDSRRIKIILNNLLSNAIRYHRPYSPNPRIDIRAQIEEKLLVLVVEDNGQGIDEKHISKIFNMFYRATEGTPGSGLGLYIVKETVLKLKGSISVESKKGVGTTFILKIPRS